MALGALLAVLAVQGAWGAAPAPKREIYVPANRLGELLAGAARRVLLSDEEYRDLLSRAQPAEEAPAAPQGAVLGASRYQARIVGQRVEIAGTLDVEVLADGLQAVSLMLGDVGLRAALLDDQPAAIGFEPQRGYTLFLAGRGRHTVRLQLVARLSATAAQQSLAFQLPAAAAVDVQLAVPGNVEVRSGNGVAQRVFDEADEHTHFALLAPDGRIQLELSLNNRQLQQQRVVLARGVTVNEVTTAYQRLHATISLEVLHRPVEEFRFAMPPEFELTDVASPELARWSVQTDNDGRRVATVTLRQPETGTVVMNLSAIRSTAPGETWQASRFEPLDVAGDVAVVGLLAEDRLRAEALAADGLLPIDNSVLTQALPASVFAFDPGAPRIRAVAAYFAPSGEWSLSARFVLPTPRVTVLANHNLTVSEAGWMVDGALQLACEAETQFDFNLLLPAGWQLLALHAADGATLAFDRYGHADDATRIHVRLPAPLQVGQSTTVRFRAQRVAAGWLDSWTRFELPLPVFEVPGAAAHRGALSITLIDDLRARPETLEGLVALDALDKQTLGLTAEPGQWAYRFDSADYQAAFVVERIEPRITAQTFSFFRLEPEGLFAHAEVLFQIDRARARRLQLSLPESTPPALTLRVGEGGVLEETSSRVVDGRRVWTVQLAQRQMGMVRVLVDYNQSLMPEGETRREVSLPLVRAEQVAYQSGLAAVEGSAEFEVELIDHPRRVDVGELAEAQYEPGRRLLGAFGYVGTAAQVVVRLERRPQHALFPVLVEQAHYTTLLGTAGQGVTQASFRLRSKESFLQVALPAGAELWSATLGQRPIQPQRQGDRLLVSLDSSRAGALEDLVLVYAMPVAPLGSLGSARISGARLLLHADESTELEVPVAEVRWSLVAPPGYRLLSSGGTVSPVYERRLLQRLAAVQVAGGLLVLGTGLPTVHQARESGRSYAGLDIDGEPASPSADWLAGGGQAAERGYFEYSESNLSAEAERLRKQGAGVLQDASEPLTVEASASARAEGVADKPPSAPVPAATPALAGPAPANAAGEQPVSHADKADAPFGWGEVTTGSGAYARLAGLRSLDIQLARTGNELEFRGLGLDGSAAQLDLLLADGARLTSVAWCLALAVFTLGLALWRRSARTKFAYVLGVCLLATLIPLVSGWFDLVILCNGAFFAAALLVPVYLAIGAGRWCCRVCCPWISRCCGALCGRAQQVAPPTAAALLLTALAANLALAQAPAASPSPREQYVIQVIDPGPPIQLPDDAIVRLFDPTDDPRQPQGRQVLVPYQRYLELWQRAYGPDDARQPLPPVPYAPAGAVYRATLASGSDLLVEGELTFDLFTDEFVEIPLPLAGGVLAEARWNDAPARLRVVPASDVLPQPAQTAEPMRQQAAPQQAHQAKLPAERSLVVLYAAGKGRHTLKLAIRLSIERDGGWRRVTGQLPPIPAADVLLTVATPQTDVRTADVADTPTHETEAAGEQIHTVLGAEGRIAWSWRPRLEASRADQALTAQSEALLDVAEDGLRLAWRLVLDFRRTQRESFRLVLPDDYVVQRVEGENVRAWQLRPGRGNVDLEVELLAAAGNRETFTLLLSRRQPLGLEAGTFVAPLVEVPDAALHAGRYTVRRSAAIELSTVEALGLTRVDVDPQAIAELTNDAASPLELRPHESYRFAALPCTLRLQSQPLRPQVTARLQSVLRLAETQRNLETRLLLSISRAALHHLRVALPEGFEPHRPVVGGHFEWSVIESEGRRVLDLYFAEGLSGEASLVLSGDLGARGPQPAVLLPVWQVFDVRQSQELAVLVDPAFDVRASDLVNCDTILLGRVAPWLQPTQRTLARLALECRGTEYSGTLELVPRQAVVRAQTVTNVRVTDRVIEETILLEFAIAGAGIREVVFQLPGWLRDADVVVPQLREQTITPVDPAAPEGPVRVRLALQDDVMGQLRVLVSHTRPRAAEAQPIPVPVVETGRTENRYLALETASRDELLVDQLVGLEPIARSQNTWKVIAGMLRGGSTQAWRVQPTAEQPRLTYSLRDRAAVETAGARIELSQVRLAFDVNGAYRAVQSYRLHNSTEQYLQIELPPAARLWTAWVAGMPVKPAAVPGGSSSQVRLPLVKTAPGDLNYEVLLVYAGRLDRLGLVDRVDFPAIRTVNVQVELSQVELYLPEAYRWFDFTGNVGPPRNEQELAASTLSYWTREVQRLTDAMASRDGYAKVRAQANLRQLEAQIQSYVGNVDLGRRGAPAPAELQRELMMNKAALETANRQAVEQSAQATGLSGANSYYLNEQFFEQDNRRARNVVSNLDDNFTVPVVPARPQARAPAGPQKFNDEWFRYNGLQTYTESESGKAGVESNRAGIDRLQRQSDSKSEESRRDLAESKLPQSRTDADEQFKDLRRELAPAAGPPQQAPAAEEPLERYRQRLEQRQQVAQQPQAPGRGGQRESGIVTDGSGPTEVTIDVGEVNVFAAEGAALATDVSTLSLGEALAILAPGLASLQVEIPFEGRVYRFATPRGDVQLSARAVSDPLVENALRVCGVLAVAAVLLLVGKLIASGWLGRMLHSLVGGVLICLVGLVLVCTGVLTLVGLLLLVAGIVVIFAVAVARANRARQTA